MHKGWKYSNCSEILMPLISLMDLSILTSILAGVNKKLDNSVLIIYTNILNVTDDFSVIMFALHLDAK